MNPLLKLKCLRLLKLNSQDAFKPEAIIIQPSGMVFAVRHSIRWCPNSGGWGAGAAYSLGNVDPIGVEEASKSILIL